MTRDPSWYVGMDTDTIARVKASDENLEGIIAGRRRAAKALLPASQAPADEVRENTGPLLGEKYRGPVTPPETPQP